MLNASHTATIALMVLIDTWWNVNFSSSVSTLIVCIVLIDTWWNVNPILPLSP